MNLLFLVLLPQSTLPEAPFDGSEVMFAALGCVVLALVFGAGKENSPATAGARTKITRQFWLWMALAAIVVVAGNWAISLYEGGMVFDCFGG